MSTHLVNDFEAGHMLDEEEIGVLKEANVDALENKLEAGHMLSEDEIGTLKEANVDALEKKLEAGHMLDGEELSTLKEANVEALEKKLEEGHMLDGEELSTLKEANVEALEKKLSDGHMLDGEELSTLKEANVDGARKKLSDGHMLDGEELSTLKEANVEALEKKLSDGHMLDGEELSTLKEANVEALEKKLEAGHMLDGAELGALKEANVDALGKRLEQGHMLSGEELGQLKEASRPSTVNSAVPPLAPAAAPAAAPSRMNFAGMRSTTMGLFGVSGFAKPSSAPSEAELAPRDSEQLKIEKLLKREAKQQDELLIAQRRVAARKDPLSFLMMLQHDDKELTKWAEESTARSKVAEAAVLIQTVYRNRPWTMRTQVSVHAKLRHTRYFLRHQLADIDRCKDDVRKQAYEFFEQVAAPLVKRVKEIKKIMAARKPMANMKDGTHKSVMTTNHPMFVGLKLNQEEILVVENKIKDLEAKMVFFATKHEIKKLKSASDEYTSPGEISRELLLKHKKKNEAALLMPGKMNKRAEYQRIELLSSLAEALPPRKVCTNALEDLKMLREEMTRVMEKQREINQTRMALARLQGGDAVVIDPEAPPPAAAEMKEDEMKANVIFTLFSPKKKKPPNSPLGNVSFDGPDGPTGGWGQLRRISSENLLRPKSKEGRGGIGSYLLRPTAKPLWVCHPESGWQSDHAVVLPKRGETPASNRSRAATPMAPPDFGGMALKPRAATPALPKTPSRRTRKPLAKSASSDTVENIIALRTMLSTDRFMPGAASKCPPLPQMAAYGKALKWTPKHYDPDKGVWVQSEDQPTLSRAGGSTSSLKPRAATPYASTDSLHRTTRLPNSPWRAAGEHVQNLWDLYATPVQSRGELLASGSAVSLEASGQSIDRQLGIEVQRLTPRLSVGVVGGFQIF